MPGSAGDVLNSMLNDQMNNQRNAQLEKERKEKNAKEEARAKAKTTIANLINNIKNALGLNNQAAANISAAGNEVSDVKADAGATAKAGVK